MKWNVLSQTGQDIVETLLANRGLKTKKEIDEFLDPPAPKFKLDTKVAIDRIKKAIKADEPIVVYGDYDADGICATAIMWEALNDLGAKVLPFIPQREKEGYGLSVDGIKNVDPKTKLIIAVDSGVVAHEAVEFAKNQGIDVIILDHHEKPKKLPSALAIIHTEELCASGIAYFLAQELRHPESVEGSLELAAIATVTDLMPLIKVNRSIVKFGLEALNTTARPGLQSLFAVAGIEKIGTYEIGFMIGPRLNASGRIDSALTALRLLCTKNPTKATDLAQLLNQTNKDRQTMLEDQTRFALSAPVPTEKIIFLEHESYHQGIVGLIAGKLVEKYYLPAIVIAKGETISRASARSIAGFNIIEAIRSSEELLINAGGHPMAAGFTIETSKISNFKFQIENLAREKITSEMLERVLRVDCELKLEKIDMDLYNSLARFAPFGIGNPEPVFASTVTIQSLRTVGQEGKHLKLVVDHFDAIAFNRGNLIGKLKAGDKIKIAYNLDLNSFNGTQNLQLKVKDIIFQNLQD